MKKSMRLRSRIHSLRTGKIYVVKSSASQIQRSVGVRPTDAALATRALRSAASLDKVAKVKLSKRRPSSSRKKIAKSR